MTKQDDQYFDNYRRKQIAELREFAAKSRRGYEQHGRKRALEAAERHEAKADRLEALLDKSTD